MKLTTPPQSLIAGAGHAMRQEGAPPPTAPVDAVVIGRNEGARLRACLASLRGKVRRVVYVDSGSSDGSVDWARAEGAEVVALDLSRPFTAARARNAGLARIAADATPPDFVQFLDGDCSLDPEWIETAAAFLQAHPEAVLVAGRRAERAPDASLYNRLCDLEWDTPLGEVRACGGDALIRFSAIMAIGGYREDVIAAEDDEMCQRLRQAGGSLWRIAAAMTSHDADMHRFGQWWRRAVRAGHGFGQLGALHAGYFRTERRRVWFWGAILPFVALLGLAFTPWITLVALLLYDLSFLRQAWRFRRRGLSPSEALGCAALITLSKFPNLQGLLTWHLRRLRGAGPQIIEYK